jgi:hypothetical protein
LRRLVKNSILSTEHDFWINKVVFRMGNRSGRNQAAGYGDPYLNQWVYFLLIVLDYYLYPHRYGTGYGPGAQPGLAGYGPYTGKKMMYSDSNKCCD